MLACQASNLGLNFEILVTISRDTQNLKRLSEVKFRSFGFFHIFYDTDHIQFDESK